MSSRLLRVRSSLLRYTDRVHAAKAASTFFCRSISQKSSVAPRASSCCRNQCWFKVQTLVPKPTIERLYERIIRWLSKPAGVELHAARARPQIQVTCRLRAGFPVDSPGKDCYAHGVLRSPSWRDAPGGPLNAAEVTEGHSARGHKRG